MFDFDFDGDFDAIDDFIEYSIVVGEDGTCPKCHASISSDQRGSITCPHCNATINVE